MSVLLPQPEGIPAPRPTLAQQALLGRLPRPPAAVPALFCVRVLGPRRLHRLRPLPRQLCVWEESAGTASLYSWTVVWRPPDPSFQVPYAPAVVRVDEGFWMMSAIIGCEPPELHDGLRLRVEFHPASEDITLPYFRPT